LGDVTTLIRAGVVRPVRPDRLARVGTTLLLWGRTPAAGYSSGADLAPDRPAVIDELGSLTFAEVHDRTNRLTNALASEGLQAGDGLAVMARNHRGFVEATVAAAKLGAHALYMNTGFSGPQLAEVAERENAAALIYDDEFAGLVEQAGKNRRRYVSWHEDGTADDPTLESLIEGGSDSTPNPPSAPGRTVILTSGTTGTPKGANRASQPSLGAAVSLLSKIPLTEGHTACIAVPLFHSWGFAHFSIGQLLHSTLVLRRRFDAMKTLEDVERAQAESLVVVPVMLQRILELDETVRASIHTSSLKVVAVSGSAMPGDLATRWMNEFGDNLYNLYGSTEVAWATVAQPADLRAAPGTAGKPPRGTVVRLYDEHGNEVPRGATGRIFVGNEMLFEGYTGGGSKDEIDGLMATGDVGRMDDAGRLFVEGRDDEMIVSGGENVFPKEVEDLLAGHETVREAAVLGVEDEDFGQRLRAFVVLKDGCVASEDDLKGYVKQNLARHKVPREIWFLNELPRNATGKVLKRDLQGVREPPQ
jgi:fatty-acyl-CoA synthase